MIDLRKINFEKDVEYFTKRVLVDKNNYGKVVIIKLKNNEKANFYLKCPSCQKESYGELNFNKVAHTIVCKHCNKKYIIKRLYSKKVRVKI